MDKLKVEYIPIADIKPYRNNAKLHPPEQVQEIVESIKAVGFRDPIGIWHGEIVEGHGRYLAAKKLKMNIVPVIRLDDMTDDERRAYMLIHNKTTMDSGWDKNLLSLELGRINLDLGAFGFEAAEPQALDLEGIDSSSNSGGENESQMCHCPKCGFVFELKK